MEMKSNVDWNGRCAPDRPPILRTYYFKSLLVIFTYRLRSGLDVYGAETSLIFKTIMAVIKMHITFTTVNKPETMPLIRNSVGI